jgi:hypothetical protein
LPQQLATAKEPAYKIAVTEHLPTNTFNDNTNTKFTFIITTLT